jgi:hypothetical protein
LERDSLKSSFTAATERVSKEEGFDFDWVETRFIALLKCDNKNCCEVATVAGKGHVEEWPDEELRRMDYGNVFAPTYVTPSPALITLPLRCPTTVTQELLMSFVASWSDYAAAGNHIRTAAELLLDALKINKTKANGHGKRQRLSLHNRIVSIKISHQEVHDSLLAIKWLGNASSHAGELTREVVFDALDIFESVLASLYSDHPRKIKDLVIAVNKRKGPPPKRKINR